MEPTLIDVHAHFLLPDYVAAAERAGHLRPDGLPAWPEWSVQRHLDLMDGTGIAKSVLSVSSPGVHFGDDFRAQVLARRVNEAAAELTRRYPRRFGFFASLPLPDVDGALVEAQYALDVLHADGVVLTSNAGGQYPGDPSWDQLWRELNDRSAVVFLHPTSPPQWRQVALDRPRPMIEFLFDSARAVADLALTGIFSRYPKVKFIVTHAGGVLPLLGDRLDRYRATATSDDLPSVTSQLQELWYDVAGTSVPQQLPVDHLLYGSDYCFTPAEAVTAQLTALDHSPTAANWRARTTANAVQLLGDLVSL
ncbi:amidohydrolase family protein [Streptomyces sp. SID13031]|uniref:amidohydrolase family protein n=1 Tax=Streptomyces sp. SID13031 TaxID=2706046 RepID=UPI0013C78C5C|nr:amidohydrolase family protein [Streptomyces sp. SID13031]NEA34876.1 amidohydrolase [Streptomyces sp. SID13031]